MILSDHGVCFKNVVYLCKNLLRGVCRLCKRGSYHYPQVKSLDKRFVMLLKDVYNKKSKNLMFYSEEGIITKPFEKVAVVGSGFLGTQIAC